MSKKISILGCGWLGLPMARKLVESGYQVKGSTRSNKKSDRIRQSGSTPYILDIANESTFDQSFLEGEILIILITSKSTEDFKNLIRKIESSPIQKVIYVSSTSVYAADNTIVNEETPTREVPLAQIETLFRENDQFQSTIVRFAGLFGYDRQPGNFIKTDRPIANPEGYVNLIHQDDCLNIIQHIIEKDIWADTFNACTDEHPKRREFYIQEREKVKRSVSFDESANNEYKIVSNKKLKERLNYNFQHPNLIGADWP